MERRLAGFVSRGDVALSAALGPKAGEADGVRDEPSDSGEDHR